MLSAARRDERCRRNHRENFPRARLRQTELWKSVDEFTSLTILPCIYLIFFTMYHLTQEPRCGGKPPPLVLDRVAPALRQARQDLLDVILSENAAHPRAATVDLVARLEEQLRDVFELLRRLLLPSRTPQHLREEPTRRLGRRVEPLRLLSVDPWTGMSCSCTGLRWRTKTPGGGGGADAYPATVRACFAWRASASTPRQSASAAASRSSARRASAAA